MSLYDYGNPQHLAYRRDILRRINPAAPLDPDDYCQRCDDPHAWCSCEDPMTAPARFKQDDIKRAVAGVTAGGMRVGRVEIDPNGKIVILSETSTPATEPNPWDSCLGKA